MADYIEFTVNVNENRGTDSQSSIDDRVRNNSDRDDSDSRAVRQARDNMNENNPDEDSSGIDGKALKAYIINDVVKKSASTAVQIAENYILQQYKYSGNTASMNRLNNHISTVKDVYSFGSSLVGYTAAGAAVGGLPGGVIGSIVGLIIEGINLTTDFNSRYGELDWELRKDKYTGVMSANRLGIISSSRGRTPFNEYLM